MQNQNQPIEEWRIVPKFPSYRVSSFGRVLSLKNDRERILKPSKYPRTYAVTLFNANGRKHFNLQRLVLLVFEPIQNHKAYIAMPKDGNPFNVHLSNLEWRLQSGANHPRAKLTESQVIEIRQLYAQDMTQTYATIAKSYGMGKSTIGSILGGVTWEHVVPDERERA